MVTNTQKQTVGILIDRLEDYYQNTVFWEVESLVRSKGMNVICFPGGILGSPDRFATQRNALFELVGEGNVDGLIIVAGTLVNDVGAKDLTKFLERYRPLPMCSIAVDLEGVPSVLLDNDIGMRAAVSHLIDDHGARRVAFIRGPEVNEDAERRYDVYRSVLHERNIPFDATLVAKGDFERLSGRCAIETFLKDGSVPFDAVVAASDAMAFGALEVLKESGIRVPDDVVMASFDDDAEARLCNPPLTTVRAPLIDQVRRAAEILILQMEGHPVAQREVLKTSLVLRGSCGCPGEVKDFDDENERNAAFQKAIASEQDQARRRFQAERWARSLSDIGKALITSFELGTMVDAIVDQFTKLQIKTFFLNLYDGEGAPSERSRMILAFEEGKMVDVAKGGHLFDSVDLIPPGKLSDLPFTFIVEPLYFEREHLGFALFEPGPREGNIYEALRDQISAALKGARLLEQVVEKDRERRRLVRYILDVTPEMHCIQPLVDVSMSILRQLINVLVTGDPSRTEFAKESQNATEPTGVDGFLAVVEDDLTLVIQAGVGQFKQGAIVEDCVSDQTETAIASTMRNGKFHIGRHEIHIPLKVGDLTLGVVYLKGKYLSSVEIDLVRILSNQAAVAIQNIRLYEMATLDPLTGVHARRFFDRWLVGELRSAFRSKQPLSLTMLDMDDLKKINDESSHLVGDRALATVGKVLRQVTRNNDITGRYGGDEFGIILPDTDADGALQVAGRFHELLSKERVEGLNGEISLSCSLGTTTLLSHDFESEEMRQSVPMKYFQELSQSVISLADEALYKAKRAGRNRVCQGELAKWPLPHSK